MSKILVDIDNLETAVENFAYASKEAGEIEYRLKQLGNELVDDVELTASIEYESIMSAYTTALNSVEKINEFFESLLVYIISTPEKYSQIERKNVDRINSVLKKSTEYYKAVTDNSAFENIIKNVKENEMNMNDLFDLIQKEYQNVNMSNFAASQIDTGAYEKLDVSFGETAHTVENSFNRMNASTAFTMENDIKNKEV